MMQSVLKGQTDRGGCLQRIFADKRLCTALIAIWCSTIGAAVGTVWMHHDPLSRFWLMGPNKFVVFLGLQLDTWTAWGLMATFTFTGTLIDEFISDAITPWIQNSIQDHKCKEIPYNSKAVCQVIVLIYTIYRHISALAFITMYTTQVDFLLIRLAADLVVTFYSTNLFLNQKLRTNTTEGIVAAAEGVILSSAFVIEEADTKQKPNSHDAPLAMAYSWDTYTSNSLKEAETIFSDCSPSVKSGPCDYTCGDTPPPLVPNPEKNSETQVDVAPPSLPHYCPQLGKKPEETHKIVQQK